MPTHEGRAIWGRGDPSSLATYETDVGTLGGLICYENHMTLSKAALTPMGEEIHAAVWPGFWEQHGHLGDKTRARGPEAIETCDIYPAMREYAFATQSFVVSCSAYMSDIPDGFSEDELGFNVAAGGSMLINPAGIVIASPLLDEEGLLTAEFDRDERRATKAYFDAMGHYARWDAVSLNVSGTTMATVWRARPMTSRRTAASRPRLRWKSPKRTTSQSRPSRTSPKPLQLARTRDPSNATSLGSTPRWRPLTSASARFENGHDREYDLRPST